VLCSKKKPLSLRYFSHWLIGREHHHQQKINFDNFIDYTISRCYHHSTVVIKVKPSDEVLNEYLFYLRRAKGQINRPPLDSLKNKNSLLEKVLQIRLNRYIGMSREGTVSLSWPTSGEQSDAEVIRWPAQFQGIYLILSVHVHGEKLILSQLAKLSAITGNQLRWITGKASVKEMVRGRRELLSHVALVTQYTLQMSTDDCGGYTEYVQFFVSARKVYY